MFPNLRYAAGIALTLLVRRDLYRPAVFFRICRFSSGDGGPQLLELRFQAVTVHLVNESAPLALSVPFQRGCMVSHLFSFKKDQ
jgi:hypothetical protein